MAFSVGDIFYSQGYDNSVIEHMDSAGALLTSFDIFAAAQTPVAGPFTSTFVIQSMAYVSGVVYAICEHVTSNNVTFDFNVEYSICALNDDGSFAHMVIDTLTDAGSVSYPSGHSSFSVLAEPAGTLLVGSFVGVFSFGSVSEAFRRYTTGGTLTGDTWAIGSTGFRNSLAGACTLHTFFGGTFPYIFGFPPTQIGSYDICLNTAGPSAALPAVTDPEAQPYGIDYFNDEIVVAMNNETGGSTHTVDITRYNQSDLTIIDTVTASLSANHVNTEYIHSGSIQIAQDGINAFIIQSIRPPLAPGTASLYRIDLATGGATHIRDIAETETPSTQGSNLLIPKAVIVVAVTAPTFALTI